jgi:hypothetical protein
MRNLVNAAFKFYYQQRYKFMQRYIRHPHKVQAEVCSNLVKSARYTEYGRKYDFDRIRNTKDFSERLPVTSYEDLKPFIERMMHGEKDVLWHGRVREFAKSSGTTSSKSKFIPLPTQNLKRCHIRGNWEAMTLLYHNRPDAQIFAHKNMVMGGSIERFADYPKTQYGDVSAFMIKNIPYFARPFFTPDFETALMADWEKKLDRLARAAARTPNVTMIGGVPTWTVVLFRRILELTGKQHMLEVWPHFQVYIHGGVSFLPYREQFRQFFPSDQVSYQEVYNATEGFFSAQDRFDEEGMLLFLNSGIYYEFLPMEEWDKADPQAISLREVEIGKHYAPVISTTAGLWRYTPGDTISFISTDPYRIRVTGRTKQFVNAFGEEVMVENTDQAIALACSETGAQVEEYTVAPIYFGETGRGGHDWLVEFKKPPRNLERFRDRLDIFLQQLNSDYEAKRYKDLALEKLRLRVLPRGTFHDWMRAKGKLGGQNKVPRLANHREYVEEILDFLGQSV